MPRTTMYRPASLPQALDSTKVHSCINIYNFREQICDRFASSKFCLRKTIRHLEKTISFVIFSKCFVVFPKYHLRVPSDPCRMTINYEKALEQTCVCRKSTPVQCKDNTFFAKIQIADFRVNISNTPAHAPHRKHFRAHSDTGPRPTPLLFGEPRVFPTLSSPCPQIPPYLPRLLPSLPVHRLKHVRPSRRPSRRHKHTLCASAPQKCNASLGNLENNHYFCRADLCKISRPYPIFET